MEYDGHFTRRLKNGPERLLFEEMTTDGWTLTKRGWSDFACFRDDELILIEVKPNRDRHLKREQLRLMSALAKRGVKCYRWSPDVGFQLISSSTPDIILEQEERFARG